MKTSTIQGWFKDIHKYLCVSKHNWNAWNGTFFVWCDTFVQFEKRWLGNEQNGREMAEIEGQG